MTTRALVISNLGKSFGRHSVLRGVSLDIARGESIGIIGGSGTGKSVLMKCMLGLLQADSGGVEAFGHEVKRSSPLSKVCKLGMLFQGSALFDSMPVWQNVAFQLIRGSDRIKRSAAKEIAIEKLRRVGLDPSVADLYPSDLSGGMQKRAGLARAIAADPELLFFDEPTTGLDPLKAGLIDDLIRSIVEETKATAVTITHDLASVHAFCSTVALLDGGKIDWVGPVDRMRSAGSPSLQRFLDGRSSAAEGLHRQD